MDIQTILTDAFEEGFKALFNHNLPVPLTVQKTRKDFAGDFTINVFPFLKLSGKSPEQTAEAMGKFICDSHHEFKAYNVVKGFLNIEVADEFWTSILLNIAETKDFGEIVSEVKKKVVIEFSSPNTNKPLHLGHIRNNFLGDSLARIMRSGGNEVVKVNLVNDRGIHICKSMLAWKKWGNNATPDSTGLKGDKLVGDFYVKFDQEYKKEIVSLTTGGIDEETAKKNAPLILEAQKMLKEWEDGDQEVVGLWNKMNSWVYKGFETSYQKMGITFEKIYYESQTYKLGKELVVNGLKKGQLIEKENGSVWADLKEEGLEEKLLLRSDGTSVYMTQDLGTANQRFEDYKPDSMIYVVGNEQDYHFKVLKIVLSKLGCNWSDIIHHFSYGMVELPEGKMKSREGTVVDADDLIDEMIFTAKSMAEELGKLDGYSEEEAAKVHEMIALGALKYFILKVDPKKNMVFNPAESIDFNGNTGPFIQYTHARIKSVIAKAHQQGISDRKISSRNLQLNEKETSLISQISEFQKIVEEAGRNLSPALIANYVYALAKEYNQFYHDYPILKESNPELRAFRLLISEVTASVIKKAMGLLGIEVPDRM